MDLGLSGKKALVCAASKGLGRASALALAAEGAEILLCSRSIEALSETADEVEKASGMSAQICQCDLAKHESRCKLIREAEELMGHIDIIIHNTGGPKPTSVEGTTLDDWRIGFEQLFQSVAHLNSAFLPGMKERKWGRIITITSLSVLEPIANLAISNAMRASVTSMLKTLSDEVASSGVTVNCIAPGVIHTDRTESLMQARIEKSGQSRDSYLQDHLKSIPAGRMGKPSEFAAVVAFLCSQQASYVTGSTIAVDGGKRRSVY
jgi:3-oxoacyl-[acyl-carrier protein] reductase